MAAGADQAEEPRPPRSPSVRAASPHHPARDAPRPSTRSSGRGRSRRRTARGGRRSAPAGAASRRAIVEVAKTPGALVAVPDRLDPDRRLDRDRGRGLLLLFLDRRRRATSSRSPASRSKLDDVEPGDPQTILIVGSDERSNTPGDPGRSDTTMLLRVDAEDEVLSLFSLPRDLKVDIPGYGIGKLNEAFTVGGVKKTLETVKQLTGLEINHVVNVDFQGFADAVDAIDCVYVDVDRDYFNDNSTALYGDEHLRRDRRQRRLSAALRAERARLRPLPAHRHRHRPRRAPAGLPPRGARAGPGRRGAADHRRRHGQRPDRHLHRVHELRHRRRPRSVIIGILKSFIAVRDVPVKRGPLRRRLATLEHGIAYVTATQEQIEKAVDEFLNGEDHRRARAAATSAAEEPERRSDEEEGEEGRRIRRRTRT